MNESNEPVAEPLFDEPESTPDSSSNGSGESGRPTVSVSSTPETPPQTGAPTLEVRELHRFFGRLKAVNKVSFKAHPGQVMGFIGPNGAGKTTTMRILATLESPTAGDAFICGDSVVDYPDRVRHRLGFMPDAFGRYPNMNVVEYLDFFARAYGFKGQKRKDAVEHVLVFTELRKLAEKPINTLSKGMSQRLGLGRTLIHDPDVLILDEPAAGLDPRARVELRELIRLLASELNKTVLISSHILTELGEICDSAVIIEAGEILASGSIKDLLQLRRQARGRQSHASIELTLAEPSDELEKWLVQQPHVSDVSITVTGAHFEFSGTPIDQHNLLKAMVNAGLPVLEFRGKVESLEDAFMDLTRGLTQ
jgi:ABC-2 type transport system ATP-binding protein